MRTTPRWLSRALRAALPLVLCVSAEAGGGPPTPPPSPVPAPLPAPAAGVDDDYVLRLARGARFFDEAIAWVARGGTLGRARDLYAHLHAKWDLEDNHHEGDQVVWYAAPDKLRNELTAMQRTTTKILSGERAWVIAANGSSHRIHGTPGAENDLKQMKEDLVRVADLTQFLTLEGLKGPGIVFEHQGNFEGSGVYAGSWIKIARRSPDGRKITFWLAYDKNPATGALTATWPGIVRVDGDIQAKLWNEDWILKEWDSPNAKPRPFRYPYKIQGWRTNPDPAQARTDPPRRFLTALLDDIQINVGVPPTKFDEPPGGR